VIAYDQVKIVTKSHDREWSDVQTNVDAVRVAQISSLYCAPLSCSTPLKRDTVPVSVFIIVGALSFALSTRVRGIFDFGLQMLLHPFEDPHLPEPPRGRQDDRAS
jgi:hypothetical protein